VECTRLAGSLQHVLAVGFPAGAWSTNCWVLATGPGSECVIVDPGQDSAPGVADLVAEHRLKPVAVLITHGHLDHTWSVVPVCSTYAMPAWIHADDRERLGDPLGFMGPQMREYIATVSSGTLEFAEPDDVRQMVDHDVVEVAGLSAVVRHAPGHTPGSVVFNLAASDVVGDAPVMVSGDVLFNQGVGRTDLPGGDIEAMRRSLRDVVMAFPDETRVLPGHGPTTTIGQERLTSPYLHALIGSP
jgi:hydroxyacylglutathione hydrolase